MPFDTVEEQRAYTNSQRYTVTQHPTVSGLGIIDVGKQPGRNRDIQFEQSLESMKARHAATGIVPATVMNFLPIPLIVNSPMQDLRGVRVPAAVERDVRFHAYTWSEPAIEVKYVGDKTNVPIDFQPIQLAKAFEDEYRDYGGVVIFLGTPDKPLDASGLEEKMSLAMEKMHQWMMSKVNEANGFWNTPGHASAKLITEVHRACAVRLHDTGVIPTLPAWIQPERTMEQVESRCPQCAGIPELGAAVCVTCNFVLDPAKAFINGVISEDHESLERLTREQLDDLGISAYVAETREEAVERRKKGLPRPMSEAQKRAIKQEEDFRIQMKQMAEDAARKVASESQEPKPGKNGKNRGSEGAGGNAEVEGAKES